MHKPILAPAARSALDALRDGARRAEWPNAEAKLAAAGPAVWRELTEMVASGPADSGERAAMLLGFDTLTDQIRQQVAEFLDESPVYRIGALDWHGLKRGGDPSYVRVMATLLDDPSPAVVAATVRAFGNIGPSAVPVLRQVRATPGRARRAALGALAEIGWDTIDPRDMGA